MRTLPLLVSLALTFALVSLAPSGAASATCVSPQGYGHGCEGNACADLDGNGVFDSGECVAIFDVDPCHHQSDCCRATGNLWCPETEDS